MLPFSIISWGLLFAIAVSDAKSHKIPNICLLLLLGYQTLLYINIEPGLLIYAFLALVSAFLLALLLYFLRVLSPGDVKLIGVIGFLLGFEHLILGIAWIVIGSGITAVFYIFHNISFLGVNNPLYIISNRELVTEANYELGKMNIPRYKKALTMPFAPGAVLGIALYSHMFV
ncbi:prepilin peptidase [Vibrio rarus]|uniref:prepilin peptidase n=1 Tax=Vibrio rarus TaxID=413403 RepID=UPI0021C41C74|nr:prepilin peptidase [Vibrio rarus]